MQEEKKQPQKRGIPVPELGSDGKSDRSISLRVKTAKLRRHLCKYFKRLWFASLVGKPAKTTRLEAASTEPLPSYGNPDRTKTPEFSTYLQIEMAL